MFIGDVNVVDGGSDMVLKDNEGKSHNYNSLRNMT